MSPMEGGGFCIRRVKPSIGSFVRVNTDHSEDKSQSVNKMTSDRMAMALHVVRHPVKADERLFNLLKLLVYRLGRRTKEGCTLSFLLSHSRLAEIIGTTRSTVSRSMAKLRKTDPSRSKSQEDYSTLKTEQTNRSQPNKDITRDRNGKIHLSTWNILIFYNPFS